MPQEPSPGTDKKSKSIMIRFPVEDYRAIQKAAFSRGLDMGPMLSKLLAPVVELLRQDDSN
jgi:predicted DNA binding CopG/RHH family protein